MDPLFQLNFIVKDSQFSQLLEDCNADILEYISSKGQKNIILSVGDIEDRVDLFMQNRGISEDDLDYTSYLNKITACLFKQGLIYDENDKGSYILRVKLQDKISLWEYYSHKNEH